MNAPRYAIYYAPAPDALVWALASHWLGRDAFQGGLLGQYVPHGQSADAWAMLTGSARHYGFHATLKAPIRLVPTRSEADLVDALAGFAADHTPVPLGPMRVDLLSGFVAIVPEVQTGPLMQLAMDCVTELDDFRATPPAEERAKRLAAGLSARQIELLDLYGYPYVLEQFRLHLTLTDRLPNDLRAELKAEARAFFAPALADPWQLDRICLYRESGPDAAFVRIADFPLSPIATQDA